MQYFQLFLFGLSDFAVSSSISLSLPYPWGNKSENNLACCHLTYYFFFYLLFLAEMMNSWWESSCCTNKQMSLWGICISRYLIPELPPWPCRREGNANAFHCIDIESNTVLQAQHGKACENWDPPTVATAHPKKSPAWFLGSTTVPETILHCVTDSPVV